MLNFLSDQTKAESLETSKQVSKTVSVSSSTVLQAGLLQNEPEFMHTRERERKREGEKRKRGRTPCTLPASGLKHIRALTKAPREDPLGAAFTRHKD